jgi:hypothetical protein
MLTDSHVCRMSSSVRVISDRRSHSVSAAIALQLMAATDSQSETLRIDCSMFLHLSVLNDPRFKVETPPRIR